MLVQQFFNDVDEAIEKVVKNEKDLALIRSEFVELSKSLTKNYEQISSSLDLANTQVAELADKLSQIDAGMKKIVEKNYIEVQ